MSKPLRSPRVERFSPTGWALFLDFDGTLVDLAPTPDAIRVPRDLPALLRRLDQSVAGALAILTGRSLSALDRYLMPPRWPAAGQHGAEMRRKMGGESVMMAVGALESARTRIGHFVARHPGVLVEDKGATIALHYRAVPDAQEAIRTESEALVAASAGALEAIAGKALYELRPVGVNKGDALRRFLDVPPFAGKKPLVLGDDVTDEAAFETALELGGEAIKVGPGATAAGWQLRDPPAVRDWLKQWCG